MVPCARFSLPEAGEWADLGELEQALNAVSRRLATRVQAYREVAANASVDASLEGVDFAGMCELILGVSGDVRAELPIFDVSDFDQ